MSTENPPEGTPEDHASDHPRRRRSSLIAASVAAAVLLAGGGGAYWASTAGDDGGSGSPAADQGEPPPLSLDGYGGEGDSAGVAPGEPNPAGASYKADGELPDGPDSAAVRHVRGEVTRAQVEKLAKALDVPGAPRLVQDTWKLGLTRDASGPTLEVGKKAPGTWTFARYGKGGGSTCAEPGGPEDGGKADPTGSSRCAAPGDLPSDEGEGGKGRAVSEEKAEKAVAPVLKALGLEDAKTDAGRTTGAIRTVDADPVLDGLPSYGWHTGFQVGSDGQVVGGSGHLATLEKGAEYPVLSAEKTLDQLNKQGGGGGVGVKECASAVPHKNGDSPVASCDSASTPEKSEPARVKEAAFGLAVHFVDGRQTLVPSWMFEVRQPGATGSQNTFTVTHPAVKPEFIESRDRDQSGGSSPSKEPGGKTAVRPDSYSADGKTLTVRFWGGVCSDYSASAEETDGTVKVRVTGVEKEPGKVCVKMAEEYEKKVTLKEPLGDREVVNAETGKNVPVKK